MRMSVAVGKLILWEPIIKAQYLWIAKKIAILNQMKAKDDNIFIITNGMVRKDRRGMLKR